MREYLECDKKKRIVGLTRRAESGLLILAASVVLRRGQIGKLPADSRLRRAAWQRVAQEGGEDQRLRLLGRRHADGLGPAAGWSRPVPVDDARVATRLPSKQC